MGLIQGFKDGGMEVPEVMVAATVVWAAAA